MKEENEWIDINNKMPLRDGILCWNGEKVFEFTNSFHSVEVWLKHLKVTHWMYLPKPPVFNPQH
jgi:hypothetical protein